MIQMQKIWKGKVLLFSFCRCQQEDCANRFELMSKVASENGLEQGGGSYFSQLAILTKIWAPRPGATFSNKPYKKTTFIRLNLLQYHAKILKGPDDMPQRVGIGPRPGCTWPALGLEGNRDAINIASVKFMFGISTEAPRVLVEYSGRVGKWVRPEGGNILPTGHILPMGHILPTNVGF